MSYLNCRRCGLQIKIQATFMRVENCPRCLARGASTARLAESAKWISPATGLAKDAGERSDERRARYT